MVIIATFSVAATGTPTIVELSLMPVTRHWLPGEGGSEKQLIERLVADGRFFVKGLRYNLGADSALASSTLTDRKGFGADVLRFSSRYREQRAIPSGVRPAGTGVAVDSVERSDAFAAASAATPPKGG